MAQPIGTPSANPFDHAFEMLGHIPDVTTDHVNAEALELLTQALTSRAGDRGRMVLLRSPRAGFGKTHLLMRLHQRVAHTHEFIPLEPSKGRYLDAQSVLDAVLRRFSRVLPAGGGLTVLDLLARRILATGLEPLVKSGEVPSQDRDSALQALQLRPVETFDFHNEDAVTAQWAMANFALLGPRLTAELAERTHAGYRPVAWWVELLFRYSSASIDQSSRNSSLFETVFGGESVETDMHEKLVTLLNLTGLVTSPVLVLDEVEGFSSNPEAALQVATFLNALHQSCNKLALIMSINGDVWETAFLPRIPCGLKDRLCDIVIDLKPMDRETAVTLLRDRAGDKADSIADTMDFDSGVVYARGLIREASSAWQDIIAEETQKTAQESGDAFQSPISLLHPEEKAPEPVEIPEAETAPVQAERELHVPVAVVPPGTVAEVTYNTPTCEPTDDTLEPSEDEPSSDELKGPEPTESVFTIPPSIATAPIYERTEKFEPSPVIEPEPQPQLPADLPQPFANHPPQDFQPQQQEVAAPEPGFVPPSQPAQPEPEASPFSLADDVPQPHAPQAEVPAATVPQAPQNVIESPFSIDTGSADAPSPFQPAQAPQQPQPEQPTQQVEPQPGQPEPQPAAPAPVAPAASPFSIDDGKPAPHAVTGDDHEKVEDLLKQFRDRYGRD